MGSRGHIELDRAIDSIVVGHRHRNDFGDLSDLVDSIRQLGLLQPITVSPEGTLICGARRLEAARQLGMRQINVWVRSGISTELQLLLAEQHENSLTKPFSPIEAAALYRELKSLIAEDAANRQKATRNGADQDTEGGGAKLAPPSQRKSRARAARLVTGRSSYTPLERVNELENLAEDPDAPEHVRRLAAAALEQIASDGKVNGHYQRVREALAAAQVHPETPHDLEATAREALARVRGRDTRRGPDPNSGSRSGRLYGLRSFLLIWNDLLAWSDHYDPAEIGRTLTDEQWHNFQATVEATVTFMRAADAARTASTT